MPDKFVWIDFTEHLLPSSARRKLIRRECLTLLHLASRQSLSAQFRDCADMSIESAQSEISAASSVIPSAVEESLDI
jgi:hypothetical protein